LSRYLVLRALNLEIYPVHCVSTANIITFEPLWLMVINHDRQILASNYKLSKKIGLYDNTFVKKPNMDFQNCKETA
jgi:hypothetical protein